LMGTHYQVFPKLISGAASVTHSPQKLEDAFKSIWYKLLPSLCVNSNITKEYRILLLLSRSGPSKSQQMHSAKKSICYSCTGIQGACWDGCFIKHIRCFRSRLDLAGIFFSNPLSPLADSPPMGSFVISENSYIDMESCFVFTLTLISHFSGNKTAR
jgi:hypothetical protein